VEITISKQKYNRRGAENQFMRFPRSAPILPSDKNGANYANYLSKVRPIDQISPSAL
jgi:hypothetical protein